MKSNISKTITVEFTLNEEEAVWLKGLVQNPIGGVNPEDENEQDRKMRHKFWDVLKEVKG